MSSLIQDLRFGIRTLTQSPMFTALTIVTLALAIGVNTAIFSLMNILLIRDLPIGDPDTIGWIYSSNPERSIERLYVAPADFLDYRREITSFTELSAVNRGRAVVLTGVDEPMQVTAWEITANVFEMWGQEPILGRDFAEGEDQIGADRVVILSHGFWERRFGSDPQIIGRTVKLDSYETTIIGVMTTEIEFGSLSNADVWMPLYIDPSTTDREQHTFWTAGRLREGVTLEQANQEVAAIGARLTEMYPETNSGWTYGVLDMNQVLASDDIWTIVFLLGLTVSFVLLIACSNVATMMLARASARTKEMAVRVAMGAGRIRILRQLLTENLVLSVSGGFLGLLVARASLDGLVWMAGQNSGTNVFELLSIDRNVLFFTALVALVAPLLFGFFPALRSSRPDLHEALKEASRGSSGAAGLRGRRFLVATQVSLALALMVVASLLIRDMINNRTLQLGLETEGIMTLRIDLPEGKYPEEYQWQPIFDEMTARIAALPQLEQAAWVAYRPYAEFPQQQTFMIEGKEVADPQRAPFAFVQVAGPGYWNVMRHQIVRGRGFTDMDTADTIQVALITQDLAGRYWPGEDPIGQRLRIGSVDSEEPWLRIVGIADDLTTADPDFPTIPLLVLPFEQNPRRGMGLVARPSGDLSAAVAAVREQIWAVDPDQPIGDVRTMTQIFDDFLAMSDTISSIFVVFAVFALVLASTGIYGVISYAVAQRTQEIGIRMALGAEGGDVLKMIIRQSLWMIGIGVVVGTVGSVVLGRVLASAIASVSATDPAALGGVAIVLSLAALVATWLPARRAIRIDPVIALRTE